MAQSSSSSSLRRRPLLARCRRPWTGWIQIVAAAFMILSPLPSSWASNWSDTDSDGYNDKWTGPEADLGITLAELNAYGSDLDNDGATNDEEAIEGSNPYSYDTDYDGISDGDELHIVKPLIGASLTNWDTDNDGYSDYDEWYNCYAVSYPGGQLPSFQGASYSDYDGDGMKNPVDPYPADPYNGNGDSDNDGITDLNDPFPGDSSNYSTANNISWGSDVLGDADADGIPNWQDSAPYSPQPPPGDADGDGIPDSTDPYPLDPSNYSFSNGMWWYGAALDDADGDGVLNWQDAYPYEAPPPPPPIPIPDYDGDGIPDDQDPLPYDGSNTSPINGIQWYGNANNDPDSDGFSNFWDPYPSDANNYSQVNNTAWQSAALADDDADTILNYLDPFPSDATNFSNINGLSWGNNVLGDGDSDGIVNWQDPEPSGPMGPPPPGDSDGDGFTDDIDPFPSDYNNHSTTNGITWGSSVLGDDDQDGTPNHSDTSPYPDSDSDGYVNHLDPYPQDPTNYSSLNNTAWYTTALEDTDGDTHPNYNDPYPSDHNNVSAFNGYSWPWSTVYGDDDADGILNWLDLYPFDPTNTPPDVDGDGLTAAQEASYGTSDEDVDCDDDGLTDYEELIVYSTNPLNAHFLSQALGWGDLYNDYQLVISTDSDADGIPDRIEDFYGLLSNDPTDAAGDLDANGMTNLAQYQAGLALNVDLNWYDQDGDGMTDVFEDYYGLNKNSFADAMADADNDGVLNFEEAKLLLSPVNADTHNQGGLGDLAVLMTAMRYPNGDAPTNPADDDNDGIPNWMETYLLGTSPAFTRVAAGDLDGDGLPDVWEHTYGRWKFPLNGLFVRHDDADEDPDADSLTNFQEFQIGSDPLIADTDGNGIPDGGADSDGDGLGDVLEGILGTNPNDKDSDDDGWDDDEEIQFGGSPTDSNNQPVLEPMSSYVEVQTKWVKANGIEHADYENRVIWHWIWEGIPLEGRWDRYVYKEPVEWEGNGQVVFSDWRPPIDVETVQGARQAMQQFDSTWGADGAAMSVSSAYSVIDLSIIPEDPPDPTPPEYPNTTTQEWTGPSEEVQEWHGGKLEVRLAWKKNAPKASRREDVTYYFVKTRTVSGQDPVYTDYALQLGADEQYSSYGGTSGGVVSAVADATTPGKSVTESISNRVTVMQPKLDAEGNIATEEGQPVWQTNTALRLCRWLAPRVNSANWVNRLTFPKDDPDRVVIQLNIPGSQDSTVTMHLRTTGAPHGSYEDPGADMTFTQDPPNSGIFKSKPIALVTDFDDDKMLLGVTDGALDDRSFIAYPGGSLVLEGSPLKDPVEFPIEKPVKKLTPIFIILDPTTDGTFTSGAALPLINEQLQRMQQIYRMIRIDVKSGNFLVMNKAKIEQLDPTGNIIGLLGKSTVALTPDCETLKTFVGSHWKTVFTQNGGTLPEKPMPIVMLPNTLGSTESGAGYTLEDHSLCFVSGTELLNFTDRTRVTTAHEVGHMLRISSDHYFEPYAVLQSYHLMNMGGLRIPIRSPEPNPDASGKHFRFEDGPDALAKGANFLIDPD